MRLLGKKFINGQHGSAYILAVIGLAIIMIGGFGLMDRLLNEIRAVKQVDVTYQERYLAEAGIEKAIYELKKSIQNNGEKLPDLQMYPLPNLLPPALPTGVLGHGTYTVTRLTLTKTEPTPPVDPFPQYLTLWVSITSTGKIDPNGAGCTISCDLKATFIPKLVPNSPVTIVITRWDTKSTLAGQ